MHDGIDHAKEQRQKVIVVDAFQTRYGHRRLYYTKMQWERPGFVVSRGRLQRRCRFAGHVVVVVWSGTCPQDGYQCNHFGSFLLLATMRFEFMLKEVYTFSLSSCLSNRITFQRENLLETTKFYLS